MLIPALSYWSSDLDPVIFKLKMTINAPHKQTNCYRYVVMASLDLSMAFDMFNMGLLIKRLKIMGMPVGLITLIKEWLVERMFYV